MNLSEDSIFEASAEILVEESKIAVVLGKDSIRIKLPTTRKLAERFGVPNYYALPFFSIMEEKKLIKRIEREGIFTTNEGSKKLLEILKEKGAEEILGGGLLHALMERVMTLL